MTEYLAMYYNNKGVVDNVHHLTEDELINIILLAEPSERAKAHSELMESGRLNLRHSQSKQPFLTIMKDSNV